MFSKLLPLMLLISACARVEFAEPIETSPATTNDPGVVVPSDPIITPANKPITCVELSYTFVWGGSSFFTYECDANPGGDCKPMPQNPGQYDCSGRVAGVNYVCE